MDVDKILALIAVVAIAAQPLVYPRIKSFFSKTPKQQDRAVGVIEAVQKWESLRETCEILNLKQATQALDDMFPLFVKKE